MTWMISHAKPCVSNCTGRLQMPIRKIKISIPAALAHCPKIAQFLLFRKEGKKEGRSRVHREDTCTKMGRNLNRSLMPVCT